MEWLVLCLLLIVPCVDGFVGEFAEYVEDLPFHALAGQCQFVSDGYYRPGQLEVTVVIDKPTVDFQVRSIDCRTKQSPTNIILRYFKINRFIIERNNGTCRVSVVKLTQ